MGFDIENGKASQVLEGLTPNPKLKLLDQVSEVMRFINGVAVETAVFVPIQRKD